MTSASTPTFSTALRGGALIRLPFVLFGMLTGSLAVWIGLWGLWNPDHLGAAFWIQLTLCVVISAVFFVAAAGCRVHVRDGVVTDYVAWFPRRRIVQSDIATARVRLGAWRFYEVTTTQGSFVLTGAGPQQFPSRLRPGSIEVDFHALDVLMGTPVER